MTSIGMDARRGRKLEAARKDEKPKIIINSIPQSDLLMLVRG